jgi:TolB protein
VICVVTADGKCRCLDNDTADKKYGSGAEPSWSPDGRNIAFTRPLLRPAKDGNQRVDHVICVMGADGKNVKQLTNSRADCRPAWSPDGKRIAFKSIRHGRSVICVMGADGSNVKELTKEQLCEGPVWSPDGKKVAFLHSPPGPPAWEVRVAEADGSNVVKLATVAPYDPEPAWSPDGKWLAFFDGPRLCAVSADGRRRKTLHSLGRGHYGASPCWSPDGAKLAYTRNVLGKRAAEVWVIAADGSHAKQLTRLGGHNVLPRWSPDGKTLAFLHVVRGAKTNSSVYLMDANGKHQREIWKEEGEMMPVGLAWKPK